MQRYSRQAVCSYRFATNDLSGSLELHGSLNEYCCLPEAHAALQRHSLRRISTAMTLALGGSTSTFGGRSPHPSTHPPHPPTPLPNQPASPCIHPPHPPMHPCTPPTLHPPTPPTPPTYQPTPPPSHPTSTWLLGEPWGTSWT